MKKSLIFLLILFSALNFSLFCQQVWLKSYAGSSDTVFNSFTFTKDGGTILTGYTNGSNSSPTCEDGETQSDLLLVKLNSNGEIEWQKTYGDSGNEVGYAVIESTAGGYLAVGETTSFGASSNDAFVLRVDESGALIWAKIIGGSSEDWAVDVKETDKGDYIVLGVTKTGGSESTTQNYDIFLVGIDDLGKVSWEKVYDGGKNDVAYNLLKTSEGDFVIGGATTSKGDGDYDALLIKTDAGGVIKWQKIFGTGNNDYCYYVTEGKDGGFLLVGETFLRKDGFSNAFVARINSFGGDEWQKSYGFAKNNFAFSAKPLGNHGFIIGGGGKDSNSNFSAWTFKIDWSGRIIWKTGYDFSGNETVYCAKPTKDGFLVTLGVVNSGEKIYPFLSKSDKTGQVDSCSYLTETSITKKKGSFGSANISFSLTNSSLTVTDVLPEQLKIGQSDLSEETLCE